MFSSYWDALEFSPVYHLSCFSYDVLSSYLCQIHLWSTQVYLGQPKVCTFLKKVNFTLEGQSTLKPQINNGTTSLHHLYKQKLWRLFPQASTKMQPLQGELRTTQISMQKSRIVQIQVSVTCQVCLSPTIYLSLGIKCAAAYLERQDINCILFCITSKIQSWGNISFSSTFAMVNYLMPLLFPAQACREDVNLTESWWQLFAYFNSMQTPTYSAREDYGPWRIVPGAQMSGIIRSH